MIVVTGGAGMIGFNLVQKLNEQGVTDIIIVDHINHRAKQQNLDRLKYTAYFDKAAFLAQLNQLPKIETIYHQGACSSTTETDWAYLTQNNIEYSKHLLDFAIAKSINFVYASSASVYGNGEKGFDDESNDYQPINGYAQSKLDFDKYVNDLLVNAKLTTKIIGLRYFNVYGYGEAHKQHMSSVLYKFYQTYKQGAALQLFEGSNKILRDFITVDDIVRVNLFCAQSNVANGIYNLGTGKASSFQDLATAFQNKFTDAKIEEIAFPEILKGKYQYFTEAKMDKLLSQGLNFDFEQVQQGVSNYLNKLENE